VRVIISKLTAIDYNIIIYCGYGKKSTFCSIFHHCDTEITGTLVRFLLSPQIKVKLGQTDKYLQLSRDS
jgi:hypothetical protein